MFPSPTQTVYGNSLLEKKGWEGGRENECNADHLFGRGVGEGISRGGGIGNYSHFPISPSPGLDVPCHELRGRSGVSGGWSNKAYTICAWESYFAGLQGLRKGLVATMGGRFGKMLGVGVGSNYSKLYLGQTRRGSAENAIFLTAGSFISLVYLK